MEFTTQLCGHHRWYAVALNSRGDVVLQTRSYGTRSRALNKLSDMYHKREREPAEKEERVEVV